MVRAFLLVWIATASLEAQSPAPTAREIPVVIRLPNSHISDFIKFYQSLTKRKVWIDAQLRFDRTMSIITDHPIPRVEAIALIRDELRKHDVEIREVGDSEAYVSSAAP